VTLDLLSRLRATERIVTPGSLSRDRGGDFLIEGFAFPGAQVLDGVYNTVILSHMLVTYLRSSFEHFTNASQKSEPHLNSIAQSKIKLARLLSSIPSYSGWQFLD
jgi:hypothetical protein